ncbi:MAG: class I SAM-dependent methyltransferase [Colwellia sp.]|nr:class I SAM-dependent methyltransferase [Colwellia sp.]
MDLKEEEILKENVYTHWYYVSKGFAILDFIKSLKVDFILDVGAGSGVFSKTILQKTEAKEAICLDTGYTAEKEEKWFGKKLSYKKTLSKSNADLVLLVDVLEHVKDDISFVKGYVDKLDKGTNLFVSVPAFEFLFSGHDIFLGHYRRYTISSLEACLKSCGLTIVNTRYYFFMLFPLISTLRVLTKIRMKLLPKTFTPKSSLELHGKLVNNILIMIHKLELLFLPYNKFAGLTVFCLAVKK